MVVALGVRNLTGDGRAGSLEGVYPDHGGEQRRADDLALAGSLPLQQRGQRPERAVHPGEQVGDRNSDSFRVVRTGTGEGHQPGLALQDLVVSAAGGLRPVMSETGDRQDDQSGVELVHRCGGEAQTVEDTGPEVLEKDVRAFDETAQHLLAVVALEVEGDRFLVAIAGEEVGGLAVVLGTHEGRAPGSGVVTGGLFDLDDSRAQVGQHHAGVGPGEGPAQIHDEVAVERASRVGVR